MVLKCSLTFKEEASHFYFALGPTHDVWSWEGTLRNLHFRHTQQVILIQAPANHTVIHTKDFEGKKAKKHYSGRNYQLGRAYKHKINRKKLWEIVTISS